MDQDAPAMSSATKAGQVWFIVLAAATAYILLSALILASEPNMALADAVFFLVWFAVIIWLISILGAPITWGVGRAKDGEPFWPRIDPLKAGTVWLWIAAGSLVFIGLCMLLLLVASGAWENAIILLLRAGMVVWMVSLIGAPITWGVGRAKNGKPVWPALVVFAAGVAPTAWFWWWIFYGDWFSFSLF